LDFQIDIENRQSAMPTDARWLKNCVERVLSAEQIASADLSIVLVEDAEIHRINREHLEHDWPTDVISFSYAKESPPATCWPRGQGRSLDGELIVSTETAGRQATAHGWSPRDELLLYVVHGILHLCGYDDLTDSERPFMRRREREVLERFGLRPHGLEDEHVS